MNNFDFDELKEYTKEALCLVDHLLCTKRDEMNSITKEYVDKLLETTSLNQEDFDIDYEYIWSYVVGFCYARKVRKESKDKSGIDK